MRSHDEVDMQGYGECKNRLDLNQRSALEMDRVHKDVGVNVCRGQGREFIHPAMVEKGVIYHCEVGF